MNKHHYKYLARQLSAELSYPQTGIYEHLSTNAKRYPDKVAIDYYGSQVDYLSLNDRVERFAGYLQHQAKLQVGDRVILCMQNSVAFVIAYYAILRCDAIAVLINPMNKTSELQWCVSDTEAQLAIIGSELIAEFSPLFETTPLQQIIAARYADDLQLSSEFCIPKMMLEAEKVQPSSVVTDMQHALKHAAIQTPALRCAEDVALILYTSGTTAHPKGCMLSHRAIVAQILTQINWLPWSNAAQVLSVTPFFHVTGMMYALCLPIWLGVSIHIMTRWDRSVAAQLLSQHAITHWCCIPTMIVDLLALPDLNTFEFRSLVCVYGGGTGMPAAIAKEFEDLTGIEFLEGWGMTEMTAGVHLNPYGRGKRQCLGVPLLGVDSRVIDPASHVELNAGQNGEIITTGPCLFSGYWKNPQATEQAFILHDGKRFFRTGDVGYFDDDGYYFIADRLKRMINVSGYKVWPSEVESILYQHHKVLENCIIPCARHDQSESVKAVVVLKDQQDMTADELIEWCRAHMSAYKVPKTVEFVTELPKTASGKINWRLLQEKEIHA